MKIIIKERKKDMTKIEIDDDMTMTNLIHERIWKNKGVSAYTRKHPYLNKPELSVKGDFKKILITSANSIVSEVKEFRKLFEHSIK
jgi:DNA-directed RNA polymerase subunit L